MKVTLENIETGETVELGNSGKIPKGWRVKSARSTRSDPGAVAKRERDAKLAVYAAQAGLPVAQFLDAARWLLKKNCPYCQLGTMVLKRIDELGPEKAQELVTRVLVAKDANDIEELNRIKLEIHASN
jgi:hypothetical protein